MVRHADVHNPGDIVYGRLPRFRISDTGTEQANAVADVLAGESVAALYSSPQLRARQTAKIINARLGCPRIHISRLIAEVLTGYEGQSNSILGGSFNFYANLLRPADEDIPAIAARMARFLNIVRRRHAGTTVAAVSHADPIMTLRATTLGLPLVIGSLQGPAYPEKCSITEFRFTSGDPTPIVTYRPPS